MILEWKVRPEQLHNHWLDCLVGCAVGASIQGTNLADAGAPVERQRRMIRTRSISVAGGHDERGRDRLRSIHGRI